MLREEWKFEYRSDELAEAAQQKLRFHEEQSFSGRGKSVDMSKGCAMPTRLFSSRVNRYPAM